MKRKTLYLLIGGFLLLGLAQAADAQRHVLVSKNLGRSGVGSQIEREVFSLINKERASRGLPALSWSERVASIARLHSRNMANSNFFSHRGGDGRTVDERARAAGINNWNAIAENIGRIGGSGNQSGNVVKAWLGSSRHRANMLGANWRDSAVGVAVAKDGTCHFTHVFLSPSSR